MSKLSENKESIDIVAGQLLKIIFASVILLIFIISFFFLVFWRCELLKATPLAILDVFILANFKRVVKHYFPESATKSD